MTSDMQSHNVLLHYNAGWTANGLTWSNQEDGSMRFAVSSYMQDYKNCVDIVEKVDDTLVRRASWEHCYPPSKIQFSPQKSGTSGDLMISTADYLRLWEVKRGPPTGDDEWRRKNPHVDSSVSVKKVFDGGRHYDFCSPITSCDWNVDDPRMVGCSSIDTTVTIWDIEAAKPTTQLIAHDKEVFDIAFAKGTFTFASCGCDGSARLFDLREMEHCTVVYEAPNAAPLLRVTWNRFDQTYLATFAVDGSEVIIIDIRFPSTPVGVLKSVHPDPINSVAWAPHSSTHIATAGESSTAHIWDLTDLPNVTPNCYLNFRAEAPINNIAWCPHDEQWMAITSGKEAALLRI